MVRRSEFLISGGAAALVAALPISAIAADYTIPNFAEVGTVGQFTFASMQRDHTFASLDADVSPSSSFREIRKAALDRNATVAVNAAYSTAQNYADGLLILGGRKRHFALDSASGTLVIDAFGKLSIVSGSNVGVPTFAVQGDLLLDAKGTPDALRTNQSATSRTFVALAGGRIVAGSASNLTLGDLADYLRKNAAAFGVAAFDSAICLGGNAPSSFFAHLNASQDVAVNADGTTPVVLLFSAK
jgi:hypothetical protein